MTDLGNHSPGSWAALDKTRSRLKKAGFPLPTLRSAHLPENAGDSVNSDRTYNVYAFYLGDPDGERDQRRDGIPEWKLDAVTEWAKHHGFDSVLIERSDAPPSSAPHKVHHVCSDPWCPGGCD